MKYRPGLDGMRALAVLLVFSAHAQGNLLPGGYVGVEFFFILSGFLISSLLLRELDRTGSIALVDFYRRRFLRLMPALAGAVAGAALLAVAFEGNVPGWSAVAAITYTSDFYAAARPEGTLLLHTWSLAVEEQFYLVWPAALLLIFRWGKLGPIALFIAGLFTVATAIAGWSGGRPLYYLPSSHVAELALGIWLASAVHMRSHALERFVQRPVVAWAAVLGLGVWVLVVEQGRFTYLGGNLLASALALVLIGHAYFGPPGLLTMCATNPVVLWLGRRSYGFYLWHLPVLLTCRAHLPGRVAIPLAFLLTLVATDLSWRVIELPALRLKHRLSQRDRQPTVDALLG